MHNAQVYSLLLLSCFRWIGLLNDNLMGHLTLYFYVRLSFYELEIFSAMVLICL